MTRKQRRLYFVILGVLAVGAAAALVLTALREDVAFFFSPTEIVEAKVKTEGRRIRLGGLVEQGSVAREGATVRFNVTDGAHMVPVVYTGMLPDLFREGQGVVANGKLDAEGRFIASEVLAKHDENYMPPEVADALKKSGQWHEKPGDHAKLKPGS